MRTAILIGSLLLPLLAHASTAQMDGTDLLRKCAPLWADGRADVENSTERLDAGFCAGYVAGVTDAEAMWKAVEGKTSKATHYCVPEGATTAQGLRIVKKWLNDNPDKLHWRADFIIHQALLEAFPCK